MKLLISLLLTSLYISINFASVEFNVPSESTIECLKKCPEDGEAVCGNDIVSYKNECTMKCADQTLFCRDECGNCKDCLHMCVLPTPWIRRRRKRSVNNGTSRPEICAHQDTIGMVSLNLKCITECGKKNGMYNLKTLCKGRCPCTQENSKEDYNEEEFGEIEEIEEVDESAACSKLKKLGKPVPKCKDEKNKCVREWKSAVLKLCKKRLNKNCTCYPEDQKKILKKYKLSKSLMKKIAKDIR